MPDSKYNHEVISKLINCLMYDGKKSVAEKIVYDALDIFSQKAKIDQVEGFELFTNFPAIYHCCYIVIDHTMFFAMFLVS